MIRTYKYKYQVLLTIDMTLQEETQPIGLKSPFVDRTKVIDERISLAIQDITDKVKSTYAGILEVKEVPTARSAEPLINVQE